MKLELEGKMVPAVGGFDGCFFLLKIRLFLDILITSQTVLSQAHY